MNASILDTLTALIRVRLKDWPLYAVDHFVGARDIGDNTIWVGYSKHRGGHRQLEHGFDLNVIPHETCYVNHIQIEPEHRGKGYGRQLYGIVEKIADDLDCSRVEMTASGTAFYGNSRANYLVHLGYTIQGDAHQSAVVVTKQISDSQFRPDWASAPGETIDSILTQCQCDYESFAENMRFTPDEAMDLIAARMIIDGPIAQRLSDELGPSQEFWLRRELHYRLTIERLARASAT